MNLFIHFCLTVLLETLKGNITIFIISIGESSRKVL